MMERVGHPAVHPGVARLYLDRTGDLDFGHFDDWMGYAADGFEALGVLVLVVGSALALYSFLRTYRHDSRVAYQRLRERLGRVILLGLEILIVADIILTTTVDQTIESAATLGIVVLVRTFLSFSLEVELDGTLPWARGSRSGRSGGP